MKTLIELMEVCEQDTRTFVRGGVANRFSAWRQYDSEQEIIDFIQRIIRNKDNQANGFIIHSQNGLCLEAIVAINHTELFAEEDINISKKILGIKD